MFKLRREQNRQNKTGDCKRILFLSLYSMVRLCWMMALEARQRHNDSQNYQRTVTAARIMSQGHWGITERKEQDKEHQDRPS